MEHVINAKYGDTIVIKIPKRPSVVRQVITIPAQVVLTENYDAIISDVCAALGITISELQGTKREFEIVTARFYIAYKLREQHLSYSLIGKLLNKDHTSIIHAYKTYQQRVSAQDARTMHVVNLINEYEAAKN